MKKSKASLVTHPEHKTQSFLALLEKGYSCELCTEGKTKYMTITKNQDGTISATIDDAAVLEAKIINNSLESEILCHIVKDLTKKPGINLKNSTILETIDTVIDSDNGRKKSNINSYIVECTQNSTIKPSHTPPNNNTKSQSPPL